MCVCVCVLCVCVCVVCVCTEQGWGAKERPLDSRPRGCDLSSWSLGREGQEGCWL